jgi:hypothetical protein
MHAVINKTSRPIHKTIIPKMKSINFCSVKSPNSFTQKSCHPKQMLYCTKASSHVKLTKPTKNRTATVPDRTAGYCIHVLRTAILRLKLFAVEKTPMKRSSGLRGERGTDLSASKSIICSESSDVGKPLARTEFNFRSPEILISLASQGSKV